MVYATVSNNDELDNCQIHRCVLLIVIAVSVCFLRF